MYSSQCVVSFAKRFLVVVGYTVPMCSAPAVTVEWKVADGGNGHTYSISTLRSGWSEVEMEAVALGGHLVSINSAAEQQFIVDTFLVSEPTHLPNGEPNIFWIGLWDGDLNGVGETANFSWSDGSPLTYTNWAPLEPSDTGSNEEVVVINWDEDEAYYDPYEYGRWNDIDSPFVVSRFNGAFGIMEFAVPIPEPASFVLLLIGALAFGFRLDHLNHADRQHRLNEMLRAD